MGFGKNPNVTGIISSNWTDTGANSSVQRYYKIAAVRGNAEKTSFEVVGKYSTKLGYRNSSVTDWNFISIPLNITKWELYNGTNDGYDLVVNPPNCVRSIWRYNSSYGWERTNYNGSTWQPATPSDENFTRLEPLVGYWFETNNSCTLSFAGQIPTENRTRDLATVWSVTGWYTPVNLTLGEDTEFNPLYVVPADSIQEIDRYNYETREFEVTVHYPGYGWWPAWNNQNFRSIDPIRGYYFRMEPNAVWYHDPQT